MLSINDYLEMDALDMVAGLARGDWRATDLIDHAITLATHLNPALNAITTETYEAARQLAQELDRNKDRAKNSPLRGVPFLIKEISPVAGLPHHHHSRLFHGTVAEEDAVIVGAFRQAGLVSLGTTNTPELCLTVTTESKFAGPCHNPWDPAVSTGGSSGGSCAAVAARIVPVAHGSDGGGSIRIPAACCGLFGLKPSRGLTPVENQRQYSWSGMSVGHVVSRSVRDSAAILDAIRLRQPQLYPLPEPDNYLAGLDQRPTALRIAVQAEHPFAAEIDAEVRRGLEQAMAVCRELGHRVSPCVLPMDYKTLGKHFATITNVHTAQEIAPQLAKTGMSLADAPLEAATRRMAQRGLETSAADFIAALDGIQEAAVKMADFHRDYDVILSPVMTRPPVPLGWLDMDSADLKEYGRRFGIYSGFCHLYNITGQPSMSVPLFTTGTGLPLGMLFSAAWGADALLLRLARQLELALPWATRRPARLFAANS